VRAAVSQEAESAVILSAAKNLSSLFGQPRERLPGLPAAEAVERYVVPEKWKALRMFSWGFTVGRTIEQLYAEWGKSGRILNYR
jgi:hypothetical protein